MRLRALLGEAEVLHTGGTSVPGALTRGDLDVHVRIRPDGFAHARELLSGEYEPYRTGMWTAAFAAFVAPSRETPTGVALTAVGGEHDRRFLVAWERLRRDPALLAEHNALKAEAAGGDREAYEEAKAAFFTRIAAGG